MADSKKVPAFVAYAGVEARKGTKEGWYELKVKKEDGTIVKMIARKVNRFWSEQEQSEGDGL